MSQAQLWRTQPSVVQRIQPTRAWLGRCFVSLTFFTTSVALAADTARVPARDEVVETQLLPRAVKQAVQRLERSKPYKGEASELPPVQRIDSARRLIQEGRASGDPRALGYAEAHLTGLPDTGTIGVEALVLRATIQQSRHRFDAATSLLDRAIEQSPGHVQARLTRATIGHVRGNLVAARADCDVLRESAPAVAVICRAINDSLRGNNARALMALQAVTDSVLRGWALSVAGEIYEQQGSLESAVHSYNQALVLDNDLYTAVALADALIAQQRWSQAEALLLPLPPTDAVLVRRWIALRGQQRDTAAMESQLAARFAEAQSRRDFPHAREAALFALERGDSEAALKLARQNWNEQREPADLRLLALAGRAASDQAALGEARDWITLTGLRDARVERALAGKR